MMESMICLEFNIMMADVMRTGDKLVYNDSCKETQECVAVLEPSSL